MVEKTKQRAGRNRTLCVKEEEIVSLEKQILYNEDRHE